MSGLGGPPLAACPRCGLPNPPARTSCWSCGADLPPNRLGYDPYTSLASGGVDWTGVPPPSGLAPGGTTRPAPPAPPRFAPPVPSPPPRKRWSTATIILVVVLVVIAASVVPAFVLYVLVSGLERTSLSPPEFLGLEVVSSAGPAGTPPSYFVNLSLEPTAGLSTGMFGLSVVNSSGDMQAVLPASANCTYGASDPLADCVASGSGWYAVLLGATDVVLATYSKLSSSVSWTNEAPGVSSATVSGSNRIMVVSGADYATGSDVLDVVSSGSTPVGGSVVL